MSRGPPFVPPAVRQYSKGVLVRSGPLFALSPPLMRFIRRSANATLQARMAPAKKTAMTADKTLTHTLRTWWPHLLMGLVMAALAVGLVVGGTARVFAWYQLIGVLPLAGALYMIGVIVRVIWQRRLSLATSVALLLSVAALIPLSWALRLWPVGFPADLDTTAPRLEIRVPTDRVMRVAWGGDSAATNQHAITSDQRWAYDLVIEPYFTGGTALGDYGCYGVDVVAPVSGLIVQSAGDQPDEVPGEVSSNFKAPLGNHVVVRPDQGGHLLIAHLKPGTVAVRDGDRVAEGDLVGQCGNSGNTSEPHVHVHYQLEPPDAVPFNFARGLPLFFRDHTGPRMPSGGLQLVGDQLVATGDTIAHNP